MTSSSQNALLPQRERIQSLGEEIANAVSHGAGALLAVAVLPLLVVDAVTTEGGAREIFAACVFGAALVLLYVTSTLYHALPPGAGAATGGAPGPAKRVFRVLDHSAIYVLIAGTYTPFALGVLYPDWGWRMFALVWGLAAVGIALKCCLRRVPPALSTALYLAMGWLVLARIDPLLVEVPFAGRAWLLAGGLAYTLGVVFFALDARWRYAHFVWHLFVLGGSACHVVAVLGYA